jgi:threonine synthase
LETGAYTKSGVVPSISPSMDIQVSSNFERALFDMYDRDGGAVSQLMTDLNSGSFNVSQGALERLRETFASGRCSEAETIATIKAHIEKSGEVLCPHSAIGVKVAEEHLGETPMVTLATAHPAKFPAAVSDACGVNPALPPHMADLGTKSERVTRVPNDLAALEALVHERRAR